LLDLEGRGEHAIVFTSTRFGDWHPVKAGFQKGSVELVVQGGSAFTAGSHAEIQQDNDPGIMYTSAEWDQSWAENAVGQMVTVKEGRGDTLVLQRPLYLDYRSDLNPVIRLTRPLQGAGVEDIYIERLDAGDGHTLAVKNVVNGRFRRIESYMSYRTHIYLERAYCCEVGNNYLHHAHDYGGGGHGYGVDLLRHCSDNLIIDNVFEHLRHSMMVHVGSCGNVFAYNYSATREPQRLCDISIHGHYPNFNLFESNVVHEIHVADYWGPAGPGNTFLRNKVLSEGVEVKDQSHLQNFIGNVLERGLLRVRSDVNGTLLHGNVIAGAAEWDPFIDTRELPISLFLEERPDFFASAGWPLFGPDCGGEAELPAERRYREGNPITTVRTGGRSRDSGLFLRLYPNPCNPAVTAEFVLPERSYTSVELFNIHGQRVRTLAERPFGAGKHELRFVLEPGLASGLYFILLRYKGIYTSSKFALLR